MIGPCDHLPAGKAAICRGERTDLSPEKTLAYLWRWYHAGDVNADALVAAGVPCGEIPDRGLGDKVDRFTRRTGIKRAAKTFTAVTGVPCGCAERQKKLNEKFPAK